MTGSEIVNFTQTILLAGDIIAQGEEEGQLMLINRGIKDISRQAPYLYWDDITVLEGESEVSLPQGLILIEGLLIDGNDLSFKHPSKITNATEQGTPSNYYFKGFDTLVLHPVPNYDISARIIYRKGYTPLVSLEDEPDIPSDFHEALCYYLAMENYDYFGNNLLTQQKYQEFSSEYSRMVGDLKLWLDSNFYEYEPTQDVLKRR